MLKIATAARVKKNEFGYDSDGELILSSKQKMSQRELEKGLEKILTEEMVPDRLKKLARGCTKQML